MNKRGIGTILGLMATILFLTLYIVAAIFICGVSSWDLMLFAAGLKYTASTLLISSILSAAIGVRFIILGQWE